MPMLPFTFRVAGGARARPDVAGVFEERWPHYRDVVPARRRGRAPVVRHERADAPRAHARAGARVRAGGRARRAGATWRPGCSRCTSRRPTSRRARRGPGPATVDPSSLGTTTTRRPGSRARLVTRDCCAGDRHERLPLGPARRHERRGPRRLAHVRRTPRARRRVRHPDRRALPARDVRRRWTRRARRWPGCRTASRTTSPWSIGGGEVPHRLPVAGPRADLPGVPGGDEPSGDRGVARAGEARPARSSASSASSVCSPTMTDGRRVGSPTRSFARRCSPRRTPTGSGTLYTAVYRPTEGVVDYPVADRTPGGWRSTRSPSRAHRGPRRGRAHRLGGQLRAADAERRRSTSRHRRRPGPST